MPEDAVVDHILVRLLKQWGVPVFMASATAIATAGWRYVDYLNGRLNEVSGVAFATKAQVELLNQRIDLTTHDIYTGRDALVEKERVNQALDNIRGRVTRLEQRQDHQ